MREIVLIPCENWSLHGMVHLALPSSGLRVGVVLFHENQNTKFGAHRLFRQLVDAIAEAGYYVLRYDDRGMCDSPGICDLTFAHRLADAQSALAFFRKRYSLDLVVGWGLCLGAAVAVYCGAEPRCPEERLDGLVLCNILADPARVSRPEWGYQKVSLPQVASDFFLRGNLWRKIRNAPNNLGSYRTKLGVLAARYLHPQPNELVQLRNAIGRVGNLLQIYEGPCLLIFSEKDTYLTEFNERVNPDDKLGLKRKPIPPGWVLVKNGDHTFASREKTDELIRITTDWMQVFRKGCTFTEVKMPTEPQKGICTEGVHP
jgi:pimeloyl-ACP methyl ester carboxylesterase